MTEQLAVLLYGHVIGHLERDDTASEPTFRYDSEYAAEGQVALSARLPVGTSTFPAKRVAPYLQGLLPENADTRQRWAEQLGLHPDDTFGMLAQMGWDCPGAVQFCRPGDLDELERRAGEYVSIDEAGIGERLRTLVAEPASWTLPEEHWSLGGQQEKFALTWLADGWAQAHGAAATTHIVKPGIRRLHSQALVEHLTMRAASLVGVDIATTRYLQFEDQWAVVVDRFDRYDEDGIVRRLHQEDFCQAVGRLPANKYEERRGPTLADMVTVIKRQSRDVEADRLALADFLIINLVAGAPDGHSKNISLLRLPEGAWVAPLYDLATGLVYDSRSTDRSIALSVGGERQAARIRRRQWDKAAATLGLPADLLCGRVAQLATGYPDAFATALEDAAEVPGASELAERALSGIGVHCSRLLDQLS